MILAHIDMAYVVMAQIIRAYIGMTYIVVAYIVMANIGTTCIVMAYIVMAGVTDQQHQQLPNHCYGLYTCGVYSYEIISRMTHRLFRHISYRNMWSKVARQSL